MPGSSTTPGRVGARDDAPGRIAFHLRNSVGTRIKNLFEAHGLATPTDASPLPLRAVTHGSRPMWIATPSSCRTCTDYSLPVSRRTAKETGHYPSMAEPREGGAHRKQAAKLDARPDGATVQKHVRNVYLRSIVSRSIETRNSSLLA